LRSRFDLPVMLQRFQIADVARGSATSGFALARPLCGQGQSPSVVGDSRPYPDGLTFAPTGKSVPAAEIDCTPWIFVFVQQLDDRYRRIGIPTPPRFGLLVQ
jgi:hypothetical protein